MIVLEIQLAQLFTIIVAFAWEGTQGTYLVLIVMEFLMGQHSKIAVTFV